AGTADQAAGMTVDAVSIPVIGSGRAEYFHDGLVEQGTWRQKDELAPLQLLSRQGKPVLFNPGQTWIEVLPVASTATWTAQRLRVLHPPERVFPCPVAGRVFQPS